MLGICLAQLGGMSKFTGVERMRIGNSRFGVDQKFETEFVSCGGLGELFGPPWEIFGPVRESAGFL